MEVKTIVVGELQENCYLLISDKEAIIVDPGDEFEKIQKAYQTYNVKAILITHHHFDHVGVLEQVKTDTKAPVYDFSNLEEKEYQIGNFKFQVIHTPGHSKDSTTYYFKENHLMFVGDFVFQLSIGRMDLDGGNEMDMKRSIEKLITYPDDTKLYPGHGSATTLGFEKQYNPYF
ncbi:MAG: MBL fold metallo-hydrolase [Firmicutes bacterium]|nr:MBL fold metallo-hydrolase [Bacillota bacterium]